ncbi:hypothetical protein HYALB_00010891 [Hymenoscyphus albidus]|uniref:Rhodopsin domain-containing protein n=1 Tax=Hymenoscyphus albidus TaxID=595503 RepID=A0A9N9Q8G1_9HELO|nr:hypothetical protein HYALB_00010891 [Hymenoscyphus albidus]
MVLVLPVPMVWGLQLPTKRKLAVGGMFFLGATVCIAGIARLVIFERDLPTFGSMDQRYVAADTIVWSYIEASLAIFSVCLPTLRPLFQRFDEESTTGFANNFEWDSPTVDRDANLGTSTQIESKRSASLEAKKDPDGIRVERHFSNAREPYR